MTIPDNSDTREDGHYLDEVGSWAEEKHAIVARYASEFSTAMKNKWDCRVYIDLYSGPGLLRIRDAGRVIWGSCIHALKVRDTFDQYIFCDRNVEALDALKARCCSRFPSANVQYFAGDCDSRIEDICGNIPRASKQYRVLSFCFVDPFDLSFKFSTIKRLSNFYIDFLVLLAVDMDASRAQTHYLNPTNKKIDEMLGKSDWRERWQGSGRNDFPRFLAEEFSNQMTTLEYLPTKIDRMKKVRADDNNRPLYRLALFSRNAFALELWDEVLKYSSNQRGFDWA